MALKDRRQPTGEVALATPSGDVSLPASSAAPGAPRKRRPAIILALLVAAAIITAALAFANPFGGRPQALADGDAAYSVTFDGTQYSGAGANPAAKTRNASLVRDTEEKFASPEPKNAKPHRVADMPVASTTTAPAAGAETTKELKKALREQRLNSKSATGNKVQLAGDGSALAPLGAPPEIQNVIAAGNAIKNFPYIWGGGHGSFQDNGYDCSGSVSYALAAANLLSSPLTSGQLANWGAPGPGKWITVYANGGHVFMYVGGLRFDTSFRDGPRGSRWQDAPRNLKGFAIRHWPGL